MMLLKVATELRQSLESATYPRSRDSRWVALSVAWLFAQPGVTAAVVGVRNAAQAIENAANADLVLSLELIARLSEIARRLKEMLGANADPWEHVSRMDRPS